MHQRWDHAATSATITLYYQSTSKEYIEFLRDRNTTNSAGQALYDLWNNNGKCPPEQMVQVQIPLLPADVTGDGKVNVFDLQRLAASWNKQEGQAGYDAACDFNGDDKVNVFDLHILAGNWNRSI